jgi:sugar O-acyltransferase (sialic acid O-acetyltransferase NeuD family)
MKNILIIGASNHSKVIINMLADQKDFKLCGIIDELMTVGASFCGVAVLGTLNDLPVLIKKYTIYGGVIAIENNTDRKLVLHNIQDTFSAFKFIKMVSAKAVIGKEVKIGRGSVIYPRAVVNSLAYVGENCIIKSNTSLGHESSLNDFASLGFRVHVGGNASIGACSTIETGTKIFENITISDNQFIDCGKIIRKDILQINN